MNSSGLKPAQPRQKRAHARARAVGFAERPCPFE
jgi:hypothetical protein